MFFKACVRDGSASFFVRTSKKAADSRPLERPTSSKTTNTATKKYVHDFKNTMHASFFLNLLCVHKNFFYIGGMDKTNQLTTN